MPKAIGGPGTNLETMRLPSCGESSIRVYKDEHVALVHEKCSVKDVLQAFTCGVTSTSTEKDDDWLT